MKHWVLISMVIGLGLAGLASLFLLTNQPFRPGQKSAKISAAKTTRLIVKLKNDQDVKRFTRRHGLKPSQLLKKPNSPYIIIEVTDKQKTNIQNDRTLFLAEVDEPVRIFKTPNDPRFNEQSYFESIQAPAAWDVTTGSSSVTVAVIDTGVNGQHEDLDNRVISGYDYVNGRTINAGADSDDHGHGTQVAGVVAATGNNGKGIAGTDWSVKVLPVKALDSTGTGSTADAAAAIRYGADNGAKVINLSFGRSSSSSVLEDAINYAWGKGVVIIAASGNDGVASVSFPAAYGNVIAVGALDGETRASFSNWGPEIDVSAPGKSILTINDSTDGYVAVSGTSIAAPQVAGEASLIRAVHTNLSAQEIKNQIEGQTDKLAAMAGNNRTDEYGYGRVNLGSTIRNLVDYNYETVSQNAYPQLRPGEAYRFELKVKNLGATTWKRSVVRLGTDRPRDRIPGFIREDRPGGSLSGWASENRVQMAEQEVGPGGQATFVFWYTAAADKPPGSYREYFNLVADGVGWFNKDLGIYWDVLVLTEAETYQSRWQSQNAHPTIRRGQSTELVVQFKNTGRATWQKGKVNLGTDRGQDRITSFVRGDLVTNQPSGWTSENRVAMVESSVPSGETATFRFWLSAPANMTPGVYREYFRLAVERITWLSDEGVYWDITVQ